MRNTELQTKMEEAIWIAGSIFLRCKTSGSSGNLSFRMGDEVYMTGSGKSFGRLKPEDFSVLNLSGNLLRGPVPSKEYPLHLMMYEKAAVQAVIHTHGPFCVLWSCISREAADDYLPSYTPYLSMKLGKIRAIDYYPPGSPELFETVRCSIDDRDGYVLKNHGAVVRGNSLMDAFNALEELEESARIAVMLDGTKAKRICQA